MKKLLAIALLLSSGVAFCCNHGDKCGCSKPRPKPEQRQEQQQVRCPHKPAGEKCPCEEKTVPTRKR